jgi:type I restriction enzyme, S subunit
MKQPQWRVVRLGDHVDLLCGFAFKSKQFTDDPSDVPLVKGANVHQGFVDWADSKYWPRNDSENYERYFLEPDDVVLAMDRPWIEAGLKYSWIRPHNPKALLVQRVSRMRGTHGLDSRFLRFVIGSEQFTDYIKPIVTGINVPHISADQIKSFSFPLPPPITQRKIAAILSAYDDLIENNARRIAILEKMAQAIYREWFVNFRFPRHEKVKMVDSALGKVPEGWEVKPLKEVYRTSSGGTPSRKINEYYDGGTINWVKTKELEDRYIWDTEEKITEAGLENSSARLFPPNTVVMAMYGATIGQLGILGAEATTNQACCGFLTNESEYGYPFLFLNLLANRTDIINLRAGAAQQNVSQDVIREIPFLVPSLNTVRRFNELVEPFLLNIFRLQKKSCNLRATRDLLLPKLISGQLDVEELDIETGEELVETRG